MTLFKIIGIEFRATWTAFITWDGLAIIATIAGVALLDFSIGEAIIFGVGAAVIHTAGEILHQIGHGIAAQRVGKPMQAVILWGPLGTSLYPEDEVVEPQQHIQRALGGPIFSFGIFLLSGGLLLMVGGGAGVVTALLAFWAVESLAIFTLGALTPVQTFTGLPLESDGDTILKWYRHQT